MSFSFSDFELYEFIQMFARNRPKWYDDAACVGTPLEWWYPGRGQSALLEKGLSLCATCPVRENCFRTAYEAGDDDGVWGGSTGAQRLVWGVEMLSVDEAWEHLNRG